MSPARDRRSRDTAAMSSTREVRAARSHTCCTDSNVPSFRKPGARGRTHDSSIAGGGWTAPIVWAHAARDRKACTTPMRAHRHTLLVQELTTHDADIRHAARSYRPLKPLAAAKNFNSQDHTAYSARPQHHRALLAAVCIVGQQRALSEPLVAHNLERNLQPLSPFDIVAILTPGGQPLRANGTSNELRLSSSSFPVRHAGRTHCEYGELLAGVGGTCRYQEARQTRCLHVIKAHEARDTTYEWVVYLRTDTLLLKRMPPLKQLRAMAFAPPSFSLSHNAPPPSVLIPPFWERGAKGDGAHCMQWSGPDRDAWDRYYPPCHRNELSRSRHVLLDQIAVMPRALADAYLGRRAPAVAYTIGNSTMHGAGALKPKAGAEASAYRHCVFGGHVLWGCECALAVALRMQNVSVAFAPLAAVLVRNHHGSLQPPVNTQLVRTNTGQSYAIVNADNLPPKVLAWAVADS